MVESCVGLSHVLAHPTLLSGGITIAVGFYSWKTDFLWTYGSANCSYKISIVATDHRIQKILISKRKNSFSTLGHVKRY